MLFLSLLGLCLFGQSMISHLVKVTAIARQVFKKRGRAMSIALMGHPIGEALLPFFYYILFITIYLVKIWTGIGICIVIIFLPLVYWLGRNLKYKRSNFSDNVYPESKKNLNISWNRSQVLKDLRFYQIMPGLLASPFIVTGVFFHQIHLIETKSWSLTFLASCYPFFALSVIGGTFECRMDSGSI